MLTVIYSDDYLMHRTPEGHPEAPSRVEYAIRGVSGLAKIVKPKRGQYWVDVASSVHDVDYLRYVESLCLTGGYIDADTYVSEDSCKALQASMDSLMTAIDLLTGGERYIYIPLRPPGHHVGYRGRALLAPTQGFCIVNNAAVLAMGLLKRGASRIAILDVDAHHGNGTQEIFYDTSKVFYISTHQDPRTIYPGTGYVNETGAGDGAGFNMNVPLPPLTGDDVYLKVLKPIRKVLLTYRPSYIVVSLGFDAHRYDPLTNMNLSLNSYLEVFKLVKETVDSGYAQGAVYLLEGGYVGEVIENGSRLLAQVTAGSIPSNVEEHTTSDEEVLRLFSRVVEEELRYHPDYWSDVR